MKILNLLTDKEVILVVQNELNSYFFEVRKKFPRLNFKLFTLNNLFKELRGDYLNDEVIKLGFKLFPNLTYSSIKEVSELIFKSFKINESNNDELIEFNNKLIEANLLKINEDFKNLLLSKEVLFVNFKASNLVKTLINELGLINYRFIDIDEVIDYNDSISYHSFFNIFDETTYGLNEILNLVYEGKDTKNIKVILDKERFSFYINLLLENIDVPYLIKNEYSLLDSKTYKFIYKYLDDTDVSLINLLNENKEVINDNENFDTILGLFNTFNIDTLNNRKMNVIDILSSRVRASNRIINTIEFNNSLTFSLDKDIFVLGLDNTFMPKSKKNNKIYSYDFKCKLGLDSLNEINLMNSNLEMAFLKQKNIKFISYHIKDNAGRYQKSYYIKSLNMIEKANKEQLRMFDLGLMKVMYRNLIDKFSKNGEVSNNLVLLNKYFNNEVLHTFSSNFNGLSTTNLEENKEFSYSRLKVYHACPFSYFVNYILKDNTFEETIFTKFGSLAHAILSHMYEPDFDFEDSKNKEIGAFKFSKKELILLNRFLYEVKLTASRILEHKNKMSFINSYSEFDLKYIINTSFNNGVTLENKAIKIGGRIDRMIETSDDKIFIIDYKTGNEPFKKTDFLERGLSTQLPFYLYLANHSSDKKVKNKTLEGAFIQPLLRNEGKFYNIFNPTKEDIESTYLNGFFIDDYDTMSKFDYSLIKNEGGTNLESEFITGAKLNKPKNGIYSLSKRPSQCSTNEDFIKFDHVIEGYIINSFYGINKGKFEIYPLQRKTDVKSVNSCKYCNFKDICMKATRKEEDGE